MDTVQTENVKKFLSHTGMFYNLVKEMLENDGDEQNIVRMLKSQLMMQGSILTDLGFNELDAKTEKIRNLNMQVRELEKKLGESSDINWEGIARFVHSQIGKLDEAFDRVGLSCSVSITSSSYFECKITFYPHYSKPITDWSKTDEEKASNQAQHEAKIDLFSREFDTEMDEESNRSSARFLLLTENNLSKIKHIFEETMGFAPDRDSYVSRLEGKHLSLSELTLSATMLNQYRNLNAAMAQR
ncbi:hypothetical protein RYA05_00760 [Pseudomonas syringae pv. actinidiae]|nr:hypothetical protein [Pseudomonas syringae pv. actinidiae]